MTSREEDSMTTSSSPIPIKTPRKSVKFSDIEANIPSERVETSISKEKTTEKQVSNSTIKNNKIKDDDKNIRSKIVQQLRREMLKVNINIKNTEVTPVPTDILSSSPIPVKKAEKVRTTSYNNTEYLPRKPDDENKTFLPYSHTSKTS